MDYNNFDLMVFGQGAAETRSSRLRRLDVSNANYQTSTLGSWVGEASNDFQGLQRVTPTTTFRTLLIFILKTVITLDSKQSKLGTPSK